MFRRLPENPLLTPADLKPTQPNLYIYGTFNPGSIRVGEEILLLVRVAEKPLPEEGVVSTEVLDRKTKKYKTLRFNASDPDVDARDPREIGYKDEPLLLSSISHIRVARSKDGVHFTFDPKPGIYPTEYYEEYGCEDARVTYIDGRYYVNYSAMSATGVHTALAVTDDFVHFEKLGIMFTTYNKDVCIFPEKVNGYYVCRHRPYKTKFNRAGIWTAYSPDLIHWGRHSVAMEPQDGTWTDDRIGCCGPPIRTKEGWLEIFHASDATGRYALGAMLSELDRPEKLICWSSRPIFEPEMDYEKNGVYGNCVFNNGFVAEADGTIRVYYGAADTTCACAITSVDELIAAAKI
jgi:predicted GH43/DUF377 family glycosyl hydrolase